METIIELTKTELIEVFAIWNKECLASPDEFGELEADGATSAESFIEYLDEIREVSEKPELPKPPEARTITEK